MWRYAFNTTWLNAAVPCAISRNDARNRRAVQIPIELIPIFIDKISDCDNPPAQIRVHGVQACVDHRHAYGITSRDLMCSVRADLPETLLQISVIAATRRVREQFESLQRLREPHAWIGGESRKQFVTLSIVSDFEHCAMHL
ncbi:hypothetical protein WS95_04250 [Burkholderia sp. MSMB1826]|nr:hypothetical protein WS95_04250 [Burkholderia sp. MSMB1826]